MSSRPLIPRRTLFDNPTFFGAKISPDGRWLSWLAPFDGVLNVWIAPSSDVKAGQPLTRTQGRPINWHDWSPDARFVLFLNDENGDENHHLYAVDPLSATLRDLTPFDKVRAQPAFYSHVVRDAITVGINNRDERWHDLYRIDVATGQRTLIWENRQDFGYIGTDWQLQPRYGRSTAVNGGSQLWRIDGDQVRHWRDIAYEDNWSSGPMAFNQAGTHVHWRTSAGRDTAALVRMDWASGEETTVFESRRADFVEALWNPATFEADAVCIDAGQQEWAYITPAVAQDFALIRQQLPDFAFNIQSQTDDNRRWIVMAHKAEQPATYFLLDRDRQSLTELFRARPALQPYRLAPMQLIRQKSRDGLDLVSYLTLPAHINSARPDKPLPMVLAVHGGPWFRDSFGFRGDHQWLADRGYAVLSVNYRGSTGFGKAFVAASEKQHAAKMHDDLIDMVNWAISEGIADPEKVAIWGASYGGYASFVAATFTPEVFCCCVPVVGISNLQTLLETMPPYWAGFADYMYRSYGDPRTEAGRTLLAERSPLHRVDRIKKPMLIFHGANDVRCKVAESDSIVAAMQAKGIPVTYVVYPDEGHGFHKPPNRLSHLAIAEAFFARHLGGACEPVGRDFEGSSHEVRAGTDGVSVA